MAGRLLPNAVISAVHAELSAGRLPFLLVCTAGTTNAGTIEDASEFLEAAKLSGSWCHIDAAHGGIACLSSHRSFTDSGARRLGVMGPA